MEIYKMFAYAEITDHVINNSNCFWQVISYNKKVIIIKTYQVKEACVNVLVINITPF